MQCIFNFLIISTDNDLLHNPFDDRIVEVEPVYQEGIKTHNNLTLPASCKCFVLVICSDCIYLFYSCLDGDSLLGTEFNTTKCCEQPLN